MQWPVVADVRRNLAMSQAELASYLGVSIQTVRAAEQGWRNLSPAVEKLVLLLQISHHHGENLHHMACWEAVDCPSEDRENCPIYHTKQGSLCWLLTGNVCHRQRQESWETKKDRCRKCAFFGRLIGESLA